MHAGKRTQRRTDGRRAADGGINGQKQTEMKEAKDESGRQERMAKENKPHTSWIQGSWQGSLTFRLVN